MAPTAVSLSDARSDGRPLGWVSAPPGERVAPGESPVEWAAGREWCARADAAAVAAGARSSGEVRAAVAAGAASLVADGGDPAVSVAQAAEAASLSTCPVPPGPVSWSPFGQVVLVLGASPGVGASVTAAGLADGLAGRCSPVLLADGADPLRSGLASATSAGGPLLDTGSQHVAVRMARRTESVWVAGPSTKLPVLAPETVPAPRFFRPADWSPAASVVDAGHDAWPLAANPFMGLCQWAYVGLPRPLVLLVVSPSRPSLQRAEQLLQRWGSWVANGLLAPVVQLVVMGAKKQLPQGVVAPGSRVEQLLAPGRAGPVFVPRHRDVERAGVTSSALPAPVMAGLSPVVDRIEQTITASKQTGNGNGTDPRQGESG